ncbi:MAG: hypothetical protein ACLVJ6_01035 [Merdibacter sp.]
MGRDEKIARESVDALKLAYAVLLTTPVVDTSRMSISTYSSVTIWVEQVCRKR